MKKKIAILAGGFSKEREISLQTGREVQRHLKSKYKTILLDTNGDLINKLRKIKPDIVFNALHGRFGEDGYIQSILEKEKLKYTHSGVISSFLAIDKFLSKKIFKENNILTPKCIKYSFKINFKKKIYLSLLKKNLNFL